LNIDYYLLLLTKTGANRQQVVFGLS